MKFSLKQRASGVMDFPPPLFLAVSQLPVVRLEHVRGLIDILCRLVSAYQDKYHLKKDPTFFKSVKEFEDKYGDNTFRYLLSINPLAIWQFYFV